MPDAATRAQLERHAVPEIAKSGRKCHARDGRSRLEAEKNNGRGGAAVCGSLPFDCVLELVQERAVLVQPSGCGKREGSRERASRCGGASVAAGPRLVRRRWRCGNVQQAEAAWPCAPGGSSCNDTHLGHRGAGRVLRVEREAVRLARKERPRLEDQALA